jgi:hypothetical protein
MHFVGKNAKGETIELPVRVKKDADYKEVYAHGAFGGPLANYHFRIDFYQDILPPLEYIAMGTEAKPESITEIERRVVASVHVPLPFLKELRNWLDKGIESIEQEYGEIQLPKGDNLEEMLRPKVKEA